MHLHICISHIDDEGEEAPVRSFYMTNVDGEYVSYGGSNEIQMSIPTPQQIYLYITDFINKSK